MKSLAGKTILITRAAHQSGELQARLEKFGARVVSCPVIRLAAPKNAKPLRQALEQFRSYDWLIFTSANAVEKFAEALAQKTRRPWKAPPKTCAVGPATAAAMRRVGFSVDRIARNFVAEAIAEVLPSIQGKKILLPQAQVTREVLPQMLRALGAQVDSVAVYQTLLEKKSAPQLKKILQNQRIDAVAFTSSSTAQNFFKLLGKDAVGRLKATAVASIGPITSTALRLLNRPPDVEAERSTIADLAQAFIQYFAAKEKS